MRIFILWEVYVQDKLLEVRSLGQKVNTAVVLLYIASFPPKVGVSVCLPFSSARLCPFAHRLVNRIHYYSFSFYLLNR